MNIIKYMDISMTAVVQLHLCKQAVVIFMPTKTYLINYAYFTIHLNFTPWPFEINSAVSVFLSRVTLSQYLFAILQTGTTI